MLSIQRILISKRNIIKQKPRDTMSKILFDANVLLDFFLERNPQPEKIERLFTLIDNKTVEGYVTLSILQICAYYLTSAKGVGVTKEILEMVILKFQLLEGTSKRTSRLPPSRWPAPRC